MSPYGDTRRLPRMTLVDNGEGTEPMRMERSLESELPPAEPWRALHPIHFIRFNGGENGCP